LGIVRIAQRRLLHLGVQIDHGQRAIFDRIAGAKSGVLLQGAGQRGGPLA